MDDFFSFDLNFKRICFSVVIGFFIIALSIFAAWSIFIYFPYQKNLKEARQSDMLIEEFYAQRGLPVPASIK